MNAYLYHHSMVDDVVQITVGAASTKALVERIEGAVGSGALSPGAKLPSIRAWAAALDLSPTTISSAVAELGRRGVVVSEPRKGTRVVESSSDRSWLRAPVVPPGVVDLARWSPDPELLPTLGPILGRVATEFDLGQGYPLETVDAQLREIAHRRFAADGLPDGPLTLCSGAMDGIERALAAMCHSGDAVALEDPTYPDVIEIARSLRLRPIPIPLDRSGPVPGALADALAAGAKAFVVTPFTQNPTGVCVTAERAGELAAVLRQAPGAVLVEDDYLNGLGEANLISREGVERWVLVRTVAKSLGPDLRLSLVTGDASSVAAIDRRHAGGPGWVSLILQRTVAHLLRDPKTATLLAAAGAKYRKRTQALVTELLDRGIALPYPSTTGIVWIPTGDEGGLATSLLAAGWLVRAGAPSRLNSRGRSSRRHVAAHQSSGGRLRDGRRRGPERVGRFAAAQQVGNPGTKPERHSREFVRLDHPVDKAVLDAPRRR